MRPSCPRLAPSLATFCTESGHCSRTLLTDGQVPMQVLFNVVNKGLRPAVPESLSAPYRTLMEACWAQRAEDRCCSCDFADACLLRYHVHMLPC